MDFHGQNSQWFTQPPPQLAIPHIANVNNMDGNELPGFKEYLENSSDKNFEMLQNVINQKFLKLEGMLSQMVETLVDAIEQLSLSLTAEISALKESQDLKSTVKPSEALQPKSKVPVMNEAGTSGHSSNAKRAKSFAELESAVFGSVVTVNSDSDSDGTDNDSQDVDGEEDDDVAMETEVKPSKAEACRTSNRNAKKAVKKVETRGRKAGRRNKAESKASIKEKLAKLQAEKEAGMFGKPSLSVRNQALEILNRSKQPINWMTRRCILAYFTCLEPEEGLKPIEEKDHISKLLNEIDDEDVKVKLFDILNMYS